MPAAIDLTNQRFGHRTVIRKTKERADGNIVWLARCDCGPSRKSRAPS